MVKLLSLPKFAELVRAGFAVHFTPGNEAQLWRAELAGAVGGHRSAIGATPEEAVTELARARAQALRQAADDLEAEAKRACDAAVAMLAAVTEMVSGG